MMHDHFKLTVDMSLSYANTKNNYFDLLSRERARYDDRIRTKEVGRKVASLAASTPD